MRLGFDLQAWNDRTSSSSSSQGELRTEKKLSLSILVHSFSSKMRETTVRQNLHCMFNMQNDLLWFELLNCMNSDSKKYCRGFWRVLIETLVSLKSRSGHWRSDQGFIHCNIAVIMEKRNWKMKNKCCTQEYKESQSFRTENWNNREYSYNIVHISFSPSKRLCHYCRLRFHILLQRASHKSRNARV